MTWLVENPWPVIWLAVLTEAVLSVALFNTGRGSMLYAMAAVLVGALLLVGIEWLVVTEVEEVENTLDGVARALEANDLERVKSYVAPEAATLRGDAERWLPMLEITEAKVGGDLKIHIRSRAATPKAEASFIGRISAKAQGAEGAFPYENFIRPFKVTLRKEQDRWLLTEYETVTPFEP